MDFASLQLQSRSFWNNFTRIKLTIENKFSLALQTLQIISAKMSVFYGAVCLRVAKCNEKKAII